MSSNDSLTMDNIPVEIMVDKVNDERISDGDDEEEVVVIREGDLEETNETSRYSMKDNYLKDPNEKNKVLRKKRSRNNSNCSQISNSEQSRNSQNVSEKLE